MGEKDKEYSIEELLDIVQDSEQDVTTPKRPVSSSHKSPDRKDLHPTVQDFLAWKGVESGEVRVPFFYIAAEYYRYAPRHQHKRVKPIVLGRELSKIFEQKRSGREGRVYLLNGVFDMSEEAVDKARTYYYKKHKQMRRTRWSRKKLEMRLNPKEGLVKS